METAAEPQFGGKPAENLGAYLEISPMNHVDSIVAPLFFAGTTGDKTVPLTLHGGRLVDAMRAQQDNHDLRLRAPGDDIFLFRQEREAAFELALS